MSVARVWGVGHAVMLAERSPGWGYGGAVLSLVDKRAGVDVVAVLLLIALALHVIDTSVYQGGHVVQVARYGALVLLVPAVVLSGDLSDRVRLRCWPWLLPAALVLFALVSTVWSVDPGRSLRQALLFGAVLVVVAVLGVVRWRDRDRLVTDLGVIVALFGVVALLGLAAAAAGMSWAQTEHSGRLSGIYFHANGSASVAALVLPLGAGLLVSTSTRVMRALLVGLLVALLATLVLSGSRTSLVAVVVGATVMVLLRGWLRDWRVAVALGLCAVLVVLAGVAGQLGNLWERDTDLFFTGREGAWATLVDAWADAPVAGHGYRSAEQLLEERRWEPHEYTIGTAHNGYLQVMAELGTIGALLVGAIAAVVVRTGWRHRQDLLVLGTLGSVVVGFMIQFGESSLFGFGNEFALPFWLLVGVVLSVASGSVVDRTPGPSQL